MFKKKIIFILAATAVFSCAKKVDYKTPDIKVDLKYQELLNSLKSGGQPGTIILNGAVVKNDSTLNERISIEQSVGKSEIETKQSEKSMPKLNSELKRKDDYKPSELGTYLNVGCDLKDDSRIEGMKEQKNKPNEFGITDVFGTGSAMVDKIFVCGKVEVFEAVVFLNANEIYFKDAEIKKENQIGVIDITTNTLVLEGENIISTSGVSGSAASFLSAADIKLNVYDSLSGAGVLKLTSVGADYMKDPKK